MMAVAVSPNAAHWLTERTGYVPSGDARCIAAMDARCAMRGLVVLDHWTPAAVSMHVAIDTPAAGRALLSAAFDYAFRQVGRLVALGTIRAGNVRSLTLALHLGFRETHRTRDGWAPGEDLVHLEMRRDECRWIGGAS